MNENITRLGIDLAKTIFQVCGANKHGKVVFNKKLKRDQLPSYIATIPACEVVMEACATSSYWSQVFTRYGHTVKLINPAYVRPYVKTNKNDAADAEALCEAASRPSMRFVQPKTPDQQDSQLLHRVRSRLVSKRTSLSNQIRGLLGEYGLIIPVGIHHVRQHLPALLEDAENALSATAREVFSALYDELVEIDKRVTHYTKRLTQLSNQHERCQQLKTLPGVGPLVATALFTAMGDPGFYKNGREFSAFLGLVPRQYSSGSKTQLKGISKRGDEHVRTLLIQGAQAALSRMPKHDDGLSRWACRVKARRGHCVAAVALVNKLARISWAVAANNTTYVHKTA